jgi:hypothetical protein
VGVERDVLLTFPAVQQEEAGCLLADPTDLFKIIHRTRLQVKTLVDELVKTPALHCMTAKPPLLQQFLHLGKGVAGELLEGETTRKGLEQLVQHGRSTQGRLVRDQYAENGILLQGVFVPGEVGAVDWINHFP